MLAAGKWHTIGAAADCDFVLDKSQVSGHHARICAQDQGFLLEDTGSSNGLFVNGMRVSQAHVLSADTIGFGSFSVVLTDLLASRASVRPTAPAPAVVAQTPTRKVELGAEPLVIGRDAECALVVAETAVSGQHARVFRNAGRTILEDLGSRNGTFVRVGGQGEWVSYRTSVLRRNDLVRVGTSVFQFSPAHAEARPGARLDVVDLGLSVTNRATGQPLHLLNHISFTALDGEVIGILGPSGSGKTSLLNVLAGFDQPTSGKVLLQGQPLHGIDGLLPGMGALVGHAPQFDVAHELLTVEEAVRYSAKLRGPSHWSDSEINARVEKAIADVDMLARRNVPLGSETRKTLSGGQKKRVNISMELVLDPPILLLDEPTSGLSAQDTMDLMRLLRKLASEGRTIILTIHQPSYGAFIQMDQVLVLEEGGHIAWFGPAAMDSFDYFGVTDREPGALLERLPKKASPSEAGTWAQRYANSETRKQLVIARASELTAAPPRPWPIPQMPDAFSRAAMLVIRNLTMKLRDKFFLILTLVVPCVVGALFVAVLHAQIHGDKHDFVRAKVGHEYLVVLAIMCCFFGALCASLEIVTELPILRRERRGGLGLGAYITSKAVTYAVPAMIFPAIALLTIHGLGRGVVPGDTFGDIATQWCILAPAYFAASCAGLLFSSVAGSAQGVIVVAVFYAIVQVVFSVFVPLSEAYKAGSDARWLIPVSSTMTASWALRGLVSTADLCQIEMNIPTNTEEGMKNSPLALVQCMPDCRQNFYQNHLIEQAGAKEERTAPSHKTKSILANLLLAAATLGACGFALSKRSKGTQ